MTRRSGMMKFVLAAVIVLAGSALLPIAQSRLSAQGGAAANIENGKKVFAGQRCDGCHGAQGQGGTGQNAGPQVVPLLLGLPGFMKQIRMPNDIMPAFTAQQVSDAALADVFAYLKSLEKPAAGATNAAASGGAAGNLENGKRLYVSAGCYECHSREGQGGAGTGPRLAPNPIPLAAFIRQCRQPSNQMPPYTSRVLTDGDLTDIYAFMQSIPKPPDVSTIPLLKP